VIVIDASALVEVLVRSPSAAAVEASMFTPGQTFHAPHLIDVEVAQAIGRYHASGEISGERGRAALTDLADFPLRRWSHEFLLTRVWELRNNLTAYDAAYVALAEALGCALITRDRRIAGAPGVSARIERV